jgi:predicted nucleic acid-binding Zn ribbon protein
MPIWTYKCLNDECAEEIEVLVITSDDRKRYTVDTFEQLHPDPCEKCGGWMKRIMSLTGKGKVK